MIEHDYMSDDSNEESESELSKENDELREQIRELEAKNEKLEDRCFKSTEILKSAIYGSSNGRLKGILEIKDELKQANIIKEQYFNNWQKSLAEFSKYKEISRKKQNYIDSKNRVSNIDFD